MSNRQSKRRRERVVRRRSDDGAAALELALLTPVVLMMLVALVDFGGMLYEKLRLASAARAGAQFAVQSDFTWEDVDTLLQSVRDANKLPAEGVTVGATRFCECSDGSAIDCTEICIGGGRRRSYVNVTVAEEFSTLFSYPGIDNPVSLIGQATMRTQ